MSQISTIRTPSNGKGWLIAGIVLLAIGIVGILTYLLVGTNTPVEGDGTADGVWQAGVVIGAAVFTATGMLAVAIGFIKSRRASDAPAPDLEPRA